MNETKMSIQTPAHNQKVSASERLTPGLQPEYEGRDLEVLSNLPHYYDWIVDTFRPWLRGHAMEIGAGIGTISTRVVDNVERLDIVEPSAHLAPWFPKSLTENPKTSFFFETLERHLPQVADTTCDSLVMVNVLEHIEDDVATVRELHRVLKPGGHLLLFVPALGFLFSELDRLHGHYRRYYLHPLADLLERNGFQIVLKRYFDMAGILPWWLINTVGKKTDFDPDMVGFYDRFIIPASRFLEKRISPPFGRNIIIIAERLPA